MTEQNTKLSWDQLLLSSKYPNGITALPGINNFFMDNQTKLIKNDEKTFEISQNLYNDVMTKEESDVLLSEKIKILISIDLAYYHFMTETLNSMAALAKANTGSVFVFSDNFIKNLSNSRWMSDHLVYFLDGLSDAYGISYMFLPKGIYKINNSILATKGESFIRFSNETYEAFNSSKEKPSKPERMVYISRSNKDPKDDRQTRPDSLSSFRIYEEEKVDEFFSNIGFEVVHTDNLSVSEKISLMRDTKILAGVTGAGLSNIIFMQPGTTLININAEIQESPSGIRLRRSSHSELYSSIAYYKRILFVGIAPKTNTGDSVIEEISKYLGLIKEIERL